VLQCLKFRSFASREEVTGKKMRVKPRVSLGKWPLLAALKIEKHGEWSSEYVRSFSKQIESTNESTNGTREAVQTNSEK